MRIMHTKDHDTQPGGRSVFVAVPAYKDVCTEFLFSMWTARHQLTEAGIHASLMIISGGCHIDDVRNIFCKKFMESGDDFLVFIDDDTRFNAADLVRLIQHDSDKDVVAGVCPKKSYPLEFAYRPLTHDGKIDYTVGADGLAEVYSVGTAFMRISRRAILAVADLSLEYQTRMKPHQGWTPQIFERITDPKGNRWGGDFTFCRKWRDQGGTIWVDPEMEFGHVGPHEWAGCLAHQLRELNHETPAYLASILKELRHRPATSDDIERLARAWGNPDWQADNDMLLTLDMLARSQENPGEVLEMGSGLSTLILAASGRHVEAIEHNPAWADRVLAVSKLAGLDIGIMDRPVVDGWYDLTGIRAPDVSLMVIDGPPRHCSNRAIIAERLESVAPNCVFIIDDAEDETDPVAVAINDKFDVSFNQINPACLVGKRGSHV